MADIPSLEDFNKLYQSISRASSQSQMPVQQQIPEGFRQATKYEKGLGDLLKIGQTLSDLTGWNQRYQELKEQRLQANPNEKWYTTLAHGIAEDPLGFALNLPGQTLSAPMFGVNEALEAITGTPYTEAYDGLLPDDTHRLDAGQRLASAGNAAIDFIGPFIGGSGTMIKGVAGLAKGVSAAETAASLATGAAKATSRAGKVGGAIKKAAAWEPKTLAGKVAWDVGEEGGEEFIQSIFEDKRGDYTGHSDWGDGFDLDKALEAGAMGAIGGGLMGGAVRAPRALANYVANNRKKDSDKPADNETYDDNSFVMFKSSDEPWVSSYVEEEVKTKQNQRAAIVANKAASLTLVADRNMNATSTAAMQQLSGQNTEQGGVQFGAQNAPLTQHQCRVSVDEVVACIVAGYNTKNETTVEENGVAKNFHLTDEELRSIVANSTNSQACMDILNNAIARAAQNGETTTVVVEKSPAFNEGPLLLEVVEFVQGSNKLELASQTLPKLTADQDQDSAVVYYDSNEIRARKDQGVRLFGQKYSTYAWSDWTAIDRESFVPSGIIDAFNEYRPKRDKDGNVTKTPFPSYSEFKSKFDESDSPERAWFIMLDQTIGSINDYVRKQTGTSGDILSAYDVLKDISDIEFRDPKTSDKAKDGDFDRTFGQVLDNILQRLETQSREIYRSAPVAPGERAEYKAYRLQLDAMNYIITQFNAESQKNTLVKDTILATTPIYKEAGFGTVEKIAADNRVRITRGGTAFDLQYSSLTQLLVTLRYFSPYFDYSAKNNPIFRSSGATIMNFEGLSGVAAGGTNSFKIHINDLFAAVQLASLKQEDYGVQARTVAKSRLEAEVRNRFNGDTAEAFLSTMSPSDVESKFISAWNNVRSDYKKIIDERKHQNGSVQQAMEAAIPQEATHDNWMYLFQNAYGNSELEFLFGKSKTVVPGYEHMTLNGLLKLANYSPAMFNMNVISEYIASLPDSASSASAILREIGLAYRTKNVKLEKRFRDIVESRETGSLFSRLSYEFDAYKKAEAKNDYRECDRLLGILRKDLDAMHALLGKDFLSAYGWFSSSQWMRSAEFDRFAHNPADRTNIIFSGMVKSRLAGLFGVSGQNTINEKGLFQRYSEATTDKEKTKAFSAIVNYMTDCAQISDLYAQFAAVAQATNKAVEAKEISVDRGASDIIKYMKRMVDLDISYQDKQDILGGVDYYGDQSKMNRSILIESMASMSSTVDEIGIGAKITRAKQLSGANVYDMLDKRREALAKWRTIVGANTDDARMFIEDTIRNCSIDISTVGLASFYFDAGRVTRPQMEKVNVTKGQSWFYSAASFTSQLRSKTVFQQITESNTEMQINMSQVFYDPRILADLLLNPDKEINVFDDSSVSSGGFMAGTITGRQVWNALTGIDIKVGSTPTFEDWMNLMNIRPELVDLICPMSLKAGLSGDVAAVSLVTDEYHNMDSVEKLQGAYSSWREQGNKIAYKRAESQFLSILFNDCPEFVARAIPSVIRPHEASDVWEIKGKLDKFLEQLAMAAINSAKSPSLEFSIDGDPTHNGLARVWQALRDATQRQQWDFLSGNLQFDSVIQNYINSIDSVLHKVSDFENKETFELLEGDLTGLVGVFNDFGRLMDPDSTTEEKEGARTKVKDLAQKVKEFSAKISGHLKTFASDLDDTSSGGNKEDVIKSIRDIAESSFALEYLVTRISGIDKTFSDAISAKYSGLTWGELRASVMKAMGDVASSISNVDSEKSLASAITNMTNGDPEIRGNAVASIAWIGDSQRAKLQKTLDKLYEDTLEIKDGKKVKKANYDQKKHEEDIIIELMPILLRNRKVISQLDINEDAARNQVEITDAWRDLSVALKTAYEEKRFDVSQINAADVENIKLDPFNGGMDVLSESTATMTKRCMDLLSGSNVAMDTGNEGEQYKAIFGISLLPRFWNENGENSKLSCHVLPTESDWSQIPKDEIQKGNIYIFQMAEGKEVQVKASNIPEDQRTGVVKWTNKNDCSCGFCATHNGRGTERAIAKSASVMSENLTIKARKVLKVALEKTIRSYTKDTKYQSPILYTYDEATQSGQTPEEQITQILRSHNEIIENFSDNIKKAANEIDNVASDVTTLASHSVQFAKLSNSFVEVMIQTANGTTSQVFTVDEMQSGTMPSVLKSMGAVRIIRAKQVFLTLDQVGKRILQHVAVKRREARSVSDSPWGKNSSNSSDIPAEQVQSWAVEALTNASDLRGDRDERIARHMSQALAKRGPMPNRGDITTDINLLAMPSTLMNQYLYADNPSQALDWNKIEQTETYAPQSRIDLANGSIKDVGSILYLSNDQSYQNISTANNNIATWGTNQRPRILNPDNIAREKTYQYIVNGPSTPAVSSDGNIVVVMNADSINRRNLLSVIKTAKSGARFYFVIPDQLQYRAFAALHGVGIDFDTTKDIKSDNGYTWIDIEAGELKRKLSMLKFQPARYPLTMFTARPGYGVPGIDWAWVPDKFFRNKPDSAGEVHDDHKDDVGAVYRSPFNVQLPDIIRDRWTVDIDDNIVSMSDAEKKRVARECVDNYILYTRDAASKKKANDYRIQYEQAIVEWLNYKSSAELQKKPFKLGEYRPLSIVQFFDADGNAHYYPVLNASEAGPNMEVAAVLEAKETGELTIIPVEAIASLNDEISVKLYAAGAAYKMMTAYGQSGTASFDTGAGKVSFTGMLYEDALKSRLVGHLNDNMTACVFWHQYQEWMLRNHKTLKFGTKLKQIIDDSFYADYKADFDKLDEFSGFDGAVYMDLLARLSRASIELKDKNKQRKDKNMELLKSALAKVITNCGNLNISPSFLFNIDGAEKSETDAACKRCTSRDAALFRNLDADEIHVLFNWLTEDTGGYFCAADGRREITNDQNSGSFYIWGDGLMLVDYSPDGKTSEKVVSRVIIPEYLSSGFSTERAAFSTRIHKNMPQDVTLALKHGIGNLSKGSLDRTLDWATSETMGLYDDYMNSYIDSFFKAKDPDEISSVEARKILDRKFMTDFEFRNLSNWYNQQFNENIFDSRPVELYSDSAENKLSAAEAYNRKQQMLTWFPMKDGLRMNVDTLDAIFNACMGRAASNDFNNIYAVNIETYSAIMRTAANNIRNGENPFAIDRAELNRIIRISKDGNSVKTRFSTGIAPQWAIRDVALCTGWCGSFEEAQKQCIDYAEKMRVKFSQVTNNNGVDALRQARALENRISFLMYQNGVDVSKLRIYGFASTSDIRSASEAVLDAMFTGTERNAAKERELQERTRLAYQALAERRDERYKKIYTDYDGEDVAVSTLTFHGSVDQTLKTAATIVRANSLLTIELPMNAVVDKGLNYALMLWATRNADNGLLGPFARSARNRINVSDGTIKSVAYNSSVNTIISIAREAAASGRIADFMAFVKANPDNLTIDEWQNYMDGLNKGKPFDKFVDKAYRKIAKISTAEGFMNQWRNEIWLRRFLEMAGNSEYSADLSQVLPNGRTRLEENLLANPAKAVADLFSMDSMHMEDAFRALNAALKGDMAQDNLISSLFTYVTKNGSTMDFLMATFGFKFLRASVNFSMRVVNNIAPVSSINYFLVKLFESGVLEKVPGIGSRLKGFQNEAHRLQIYNDFREALAVDMAHMSMTAVAALLAMTVGGIEPPEDEDKWANEGEWTICGFRVSMNWWLKDVLGLTLPLAITWKSALLGKPQFFTLFDSLSDAVMSNPWIKVGDIVSAIVDPDEATNELSEAIEAYSNYPGGAPDGMEYIMGSAGAFGLSYLGQFITPGFVKELTRVLPKWEHSSNKIYIEDITGSNTDPTYRTTLTTFQDAQIRKVTKGNVFLGLLADMFNDTSTGYTVWEMPRQTVADPTQIAFMNHYSIHNTDGTLKDPDEIQATCLELVYMLQSYGDADKLRSAGFYIDYDTRAAVSKLLSDFKTYVKQYYQQVSIDTNDLDPAVLGVGSIIAGSENGKEIVSSYNALIAEIESMHDLLWDDKLMSGLTYYNRYNTTWDEDLYGNIYATGYRDNLAGLLMPFKVAPTTSTAGWDEDWATVSAVTGEPMYDRNDNGLRALIPANIDDWGQKDDDGNVTYSDLYKLLWGKNGLGYGNGNGGSGGGYSRRSGGGGYSSTPRIYAPNSGSPRYSTPDAQYRFNRPITNVGLNDYYLRPGFETKGSRKAYRREDI